MNRFENLFCFVYIATNIKSFIDLEWIFHSETNDDNYAANEEHRMLKDIEENWDFR